MHAFVKAALVDFRPTTIQWTDNVREGHMLLKKHQRVFVHALMLGFVRFLHG